MSDLSSDPLPDDAAQRPAPTGDDLLPPVEPPSAAFIVQLFIVPALIVLVVVMVWLTFSWLVHRTSVRPEDLVQGLQGSGVARWQRASELADMLRNERYPEFRTNAAAAAKLAEILDREIDAGAQPGGMEDEPLMLRWFLSRALGEFQVQEGVDVLLKEATTERDPREQSARLRAIEALAVRIHNLRQLDPPQEIEAAELEPTLIELAADPDELVRSATAYTLGQLGTPVALNELEMLVDDPHADTRYNAATSLGHHGRDAGVETLAEMLDPLEMVSVQEEQGAADQIFKRAVIMTNAMRAAEALAAQNPAADLSEVRAALEALIHTQPQTLREARVDPSVLSDARHTLEAIE